MLHRARKLLAEGTAYGIILTIAVAVAAQFGLLDNLERWFYDRRAAMCQVFTPPPTDRLVHLDIDDAAMDAVGAWPWHRSILAQMVDEIHLAEPKAMAMDVLFAEPQETRIMRGDDGKEHEINDDRLFAKSLKDLGCALVPVSLPPKPTKALTPVQRTLREALTKNLELSEVDEALALLQHRGFSEQDARRTVGDDFLEFRRQAMYERVFAQLQHGPMNVEQLRMLLLPKTDPNIQSPTVRVLKDQYDQASAQLALQPLTLPIPANLPPLLRADMTLRAIEPITRAARSTGFVDYPPEADGTVRRVPLFMEHEGRMYPQISVALAARMLDVDIKDVRLSDDAVTIPLPNRPPVVLPVYTIWSRSLGHSIPMMFDIPFFGTVNNYKTMYDKVGGVHLSINTVWDACLTRQRLDGNARQADEALRATYELLEGDKLKAFVEHPLPIENVNARVKLLESAVKDYAEYFDLAEHTKPEELHSESERQNNAKLAASGKAIRFALQQFTMLRRQLTEQRAVLHQRLHGRAVLIGWVTTAQTGDVHPTSLHAECPGVIVHGVILNSILTNHFWRRVPAWIDVLMILLLGLCATFLATQLSPAQALLSAILLGGLYAAINGFAVFDWGNHIMTLAGPLVAIAVVWAGCTLIRLLAESRERQRIALETAGLQHEMNLAKKAQEALIPKNPPQLPKVDAVGWTMPASTTGGDCFDLWKTPDGRLGILLADASGHGLGPAMIVTQVRTLVRALSEVESHPHRLLERVNARLANDLESGQFVTTFLAFLSIDGVFQWTSAGHGPVYVRSCANGEMQELEPPSPPLGIVPEWFDEPPPPIQMEAGSMLLLVSDGIFEAVTPAHDMFGVDRMLDIIRAKGPGMSLDLVKTLREAVAKWYDTEDPHDDQTIVIVQREG